MSMVTLSIGLDYHPGSVQVCVMNPQGKVLANGTRGNSAEELDRVVHHQYGVRIRAAIEVDPGAAHLAHELVTKFGWSAEMAHPGYMSHGSSKAPTKRTIATQSLLADLTRVGYLPKVWLAPPEIQDLRTLVRHRAELTAQKRAKKLRVRALLRNPELRRVLIEAAQRLVRFDEGWQDFYQRMRERGKPYCVIAAAVANRWLRRMYPGGMNGHAHSTETTVTPEHNSTLTA